MAGIVKINVDAALTSTGSSIAAIARDYTGSILKAWAKHTSHLDSTTAEAFAIFWALELGLS